MGVHAIIGMPPIIIIMGIPMLIIFIMASQRSRNISTVTPSAGIILQVMPSLPISMVMRHAIGMPIPDIMLGIIPIMGIIPDIMFGIIPIMGIIPGIMLGIIPIMGIIPDIVLGSIPDIMFGIIPGIIPDIVLGIIPGIMFGIIPIVGIMLGIIPDVIGICMAGIMAVFSILLPMSDRDPPRVARRESGIYTFPPVQQTSWQVQQTCSVIDGSASVLASSLRLTRSRWR